MFKKLLYICLLTFSQLCHATIHIKLEDVQQHIFPNEKLVQTPINLSDDVRNKMQEASTVREPLKAERIWKGEKGDWLVVDEVVGKHEMIKYAVGINANGTVKQIMVMDYVESYGYEVAEVSWLQQFVGKNAQSPMKLNKGIDGISGATLSCKHLSDGVKRVMTMYELVLKNHK